MADSTNLQAAAYTAQGSPREKVALPGDTFDGTVNMPAMHLAVKAYLANQRQGTHATKTRRWVVGGNQKPWRQKGTGRARQGSIRAPNWPGGGTVFGPHPRSYREGITRQAKALARKSALNARAAEGSLHIIDAFAYDAPKTSRLVQLLARLDVAHKKVLILTDGAKSNVYLSGRNLPNVHVMPYSDVSTYHLLWSDVVLVESAALGSALAPANEKQLAKVKVLKKKVVVKAAAAEGEAEAAPKTRSKLPRSRKPAAAAKKSAPKAGGSRAKKAPAKKAAPKTTARKSGSAPKKKGK